MGHLDSNDKACPGVSRLVQREDTLELPLQVGLRTSKQSEF